MVGSLFQKTFWIGFSYLLSGALIATASSAPIGVSNIVNLIGSDIGSLLLPIGLASLIWMYILKQNKIKVKWKDYLSVPLIIIPLTTVVTLFLLFYWVHLFFSL